jgi:hypothetical protein
MKNLIDASNKRKWEIAGSIVLLALFVGPFLTLASSRKDFYVDNKATGSEDGSAANPYHTISEALRHANDKTDVHVLKGVYEDNIEIPEGVKVFGSGADDVVIRAKSRKKAVVSMKDDTEINKVTIEKGKNGIWIKGNAKVSVINCVIQNNTSDGIKIEKGKVSNGNKVSITDSKIEDNGKNGILSGKRRLVLINNEILENDNDGIILDAGSSAWIEKNSIKDNDGSGMKLTLDGSDIWTKSNSIRNNDREGIEVNAYGQSGRIDINKSKIIGNNRFGVARVQRAQFSRSIWNGLTVQSNTVFDTNKFGNVSSVVFVF